MEKKDKKENGRLLLRKSTERRGYSMLATRKYQENGRYEKIVKQARKIEGKCSCKMFTMEKDNAEQRVRRVGTRYLNMCGGYRTKCL